jgi:hypothetical protein
MKRLFFALVLALVLALPGTVLADFGSGTFTDKDGLTCNWTSYGSDSYQNADVQCSGYVHVSSSYSCTNSGFGWNCGTARTRIG